MKILFEDVRLDLKETVQKYTKALGIQNSECSFTNLLMWGSEGKIAIAQEGNVLFVRYAYPNFPLFMLSPLTFGPLEAAVKRAEEEMKRLGVVPQFRGIREEEQGIYAALGYSVRPDRGNFDYVYSGEKLRTLAGKKLHGKRNHINRFLEENPSWEYVKLDGSMLEECMSVYNEWCQGKDEDDPDCVGEAYAIRTGITHMEALGLVGGGIRVGGTLAAFTLAERIDPEMAVVHIEKADGKINGLYPFINQQFVTRELPDVEWINREEDMGIEGLRKAKLSYHPDRMIEKYEAILEDTTH